MNDQDILAEIKTKSTEEDGKNKLTCASAFEVAAVLNLDLKQVARICNKNGIKINKCQLGCFK